MDDLNMSENNIDKLRDKVNVAVRVRPFLTREQGETEKWIVKNNELRQKQMDEKTGVVSAYAFDHVFDQDVKTIELYNRIVSPIVLDSFKGFNGTILCYGQTSSGKTHTMYGGGDDQGIISLFAEHLFEQIKIDEECKEYFIKVGVIEIYNEKLTDLLKPENTNNAIDVRIGRDGSVVPYGLTEVKVTNSSELTDTVKLAHAQRKTRETLMNDQSSRSHTVLRVSIEVANLSSVPTEDGEPSDAPSSALTTSVLHFVDLAGSEKQSQTGSEGDGLKEAGHINKSLSTLSMVINQLSKGTQPLEQSEQAVHRNTPWTEPRKGTMAPRITQQTNNQPINQTNKPLPPANQANKPLPPANQTNHISFRNSKLTRLLESTLRGEAYITMICNVTIANLSETKSTLNFAKTAKNIKVQPKQNFGTSNELKKKIFELQQTVEEKDKEVHRLQKKLESYQKILPGQHAVQKLKCQLNRSYEIASPDKRRHTMCPSTSGYTVPAFKLPYTKFPSDDGTFMSTEETALHFQKLTSERESRLGEGSCDKEVQTDAQRFTTPKRTNTAATSCDTPVQTLRLTTSILRDAYETDALEWTDRMSFLEEENKTLRFLEAENKALLEDLTEKIKIVNAEKIELENDVLRQMQASKKEMHRRVADSAEYGELQRKLQELSSKIDIITTAAETEKLQLQTELAQQATHLNNIIEQKEAENAKLTQEREETVAALQSKLDTIIKTAEEDKAILQAKISQQSTHDEIIQQNTDKILKMTKEREDAEEKYRLLESSEQELEETVAALQSQLNALVKTAEEDKAMLQATMSQQSTLYEEIIEEKASEIVRLTKDREDAEEKYRLLESSEKELEGTVAALQSKLDTITNTAEQDKAILQAKISDQSTLEENIKQKTDEILKISKERDEAEEKYRLLESTDQDLGSTVTALQSKLNSITKTAEEDKAILRAKISQQSSLEEIIEQKSDEILKLTKEREEAEEKYRLLESSEQDLGSTVTALQSKLDTIIKTAEEDKAILQATMSRQSAHYEEIIKEKTNEILRLTKDREEAVEKYRLLESSEQELEETVTALQSKLDAFAKSAEEAAILQTKITQNSTHEEIIEQKTDEILKLTKEREEAEEKYRLLESSEQELERTVAALQIKLDAITKLAEEDKAILQAKISQQSTLKEIIVQKSDEILKLTKEREEAEEKYRLLESSEKDLGSTVTALQSKLNSITKTAEEDKAILRAKISQQSSLEEIIEQKSDEILKLTKEREEAEEKYRLLESSEKGLEGTVAALQIKLDVITKSAEEDMAILRAKIAQQSTLEEIIEQKSDEILKLTKEREEAEEKYRLLESSEKELEGTVAALQIKLDVITKSAEEDKAAETEKLQLQTELAQQATHLNNIIEQKEAENAKLTQEREETVAALQSKLDTITKIAEEDKAILQATISQQSTLEEIIKQKTDDILKITKEREEAVEKYRLLESSEQDLGRTVTVLQSKLDSITKSAEEDKVILQAKLSDCMSNFEIIIQQMKSEISKVSKEREEFEDKCVLLQSSEGKLKESFNQLLVVEKGILEKELQEKQAEVTRLEEELKTLREASRSPTPGSSGKQQKIKVNRNVQCELSKDDEAYYNEVRKACMAYRARAKKAEADLEKLGDTVQLLNEKDSRITELEASVERLEQDIRDLNKIILDSVPVDDGREFGFERGIQCNLLEEQIEDAKIGDKKSLLPTSVANILTLRSEVQVLKDKNHHLYSLLRRYESQQEQAAAAGGLLSSSSQSRSTFGIGTLRPSNSSAGPLRMNYGPRISPAAPFQLPSSKPKLKTPSQFMNQRVTVAPAQETQRRDPEEVENVPVHPSTNQLINKDSGNQKKKNGDDNVVPEHLNPKRIKISSTTPAAKEQPKSIAGEVSSSSVVSHSSNVPPSNVVRSSSSSVGVQPPPPAMVTLDEDDDSDDGSEDYFKFLDSQMNINKNQSQTVSLPQPPPPPPKPQQPALFTLEESDDEDDGETLMDFYEKLSKESEEKKKQQQSLQDSNV